MGQAQADGQLADAAAEAGQLAVKDARHEASRQILSLWFAAVRAGQARQAAQENARAAAELATLTPAGPVGDASRLDGELAAADQLACKPHWRRPLQPNRPRRRNCRPVFRVARPMMPLTPRCLCCRRPTERLRTQYIQDSHEYRLAMAEEVQAQQMAKRADLERRPIPPSACSYRWSVVVRNASWE
ncbi:hypothetical protein GCM10023063_49940 [Arthrobacter methylotrophus]|uniref:hypothetical protein n=1 Tax=Arthrobacter methylotrophus TaxID=121291 RepID=UPI0031E6319F